MLISRIYYKLTNKNIDSLIIIRNSKLQYIKNVLRKKKGDMISLFDGNGYEIISEIKEVSSKYILLILKKKLYTYKSFFKINVIQPIIKIKKMDFLLEKTNELGVFSFTPVFTHFSSKNFFFFNKKKMIHWEKKIISSSEQNGRNIFMILNKPQCLIQLCEKIKKINSIKLYLQPFAKKSFLALFNKLSNNKRNNRMIKNKFFILVGPEGGFSNNELLLLRKSSFIAYNFCSNILCSETAMISATSIIMNFIYTLENKYE